MREYKFKVGDIVIGNSIANDLYTYTKKGVTGKVISLGESGFRILCHVNNNDYTVDYKAFDLHIPHNTEINNYEIF